VNRFDAITALLLAGTASRDIPGAILGLLIAVVVLGIPAVFAFGFSLRWAWMESGSWITAIFSRWWPGVRGEIVRSDIEVLGLPSGVDLKELSSKPNWNRRHSVEFKTQFLYRYEVRGRQYEGSRISCGSFLDFGKYNEGAARSHLIGLEKGALVTVYYNPVWPSWSTLRRELPSLHVAMFSYFFAIPLLLFGSAGMLGISGLMIEKCFRDLGLLK
jgi:hypothetical protein